MIGYFSISARSLLIYIRFFNEIKIMSLVPGVFGTTKMNNFKRIIFSKGTQKMQYFMINVTLKKYFIFVKFCSMILDYRSVHLQNNKKISFHIWLLKTIKNCL